MGHTKSYALHAVILARNTNTTATTITINTMYCYLLPPSLKVSLDLIDNRNKKKHVTECNQQQNSVTRQ